MKVRITGPESSGKSTLARELAWALDGIYVAEQARQYLNHRGGHYGPEDLPLIWEQQRQAEEAALALSPTLVCCDTGPEVIAIWSQVKYGYCPPTIANAVRDRHYNLTLLCVPDLPWVDDPLREHPDREDRYSLLNHYEKMLDEYYLIAGNYRLDAALQLLHNHARTY